MVKLKQRNVEKIKPDRGDRPVLWVFFAVFAFYSVTLVFPLLWILYNSFMNKQDFMFHPWSLITSPEFSNYSVIFQEFNLGEMFFNSLTLVAVLPTVSTFSTLCAAYAVGRFRFKLRKVVYTCALITLFVPISGTLSVTYMIMYDLLLIDTFPGMIVMNLGGLGFNFLVMLGILETISESYAEAAYIDGAGYWRTFLQIMLPQILPVLSAIWILGAIGTYNDYATPYLFYSSHPTVATGLKMLENNLTQGEFVHDYPKLFAAIVITTAPIIALFVIFQKPIMTLSLGGGIKE